MWAVLPCTCLLRRNLLVIVCLGLLPSAVRPISVTYALRISASVSMYFYIIIIYVCIYMRRLVTPASQGMCSKTVSLTVTWMLSSKSNLWHRDLDKSFT